MRTKKLPELREMLTAPEKLALIVFCKCLHSTFTFLYLMLCHLKSKGNIPLAAKNSGNTT